MSNIALVGKPNSGKSSLFNLLTGLNQKIGNYSGVTVERKEGQFKSFKINDLPGLNSLRSESGEEVIAKNEILKYAEHNVPIIFVANGMQLEDNLLLFSEIADLSLPMLLAVNFKDDLEKNNIEVDAQRLEDQLGCPVVLLNSRKGEGIQDLKKAIEGNTFREPHAVCRSLYDQVSDQQISNSYKKQISFPGDADSKLIEQDYIKRQKIISGIVHASVRKPIENSFLEDSKWWDKFLLHPIYGLVIFLMVMYLVFQSVFALSSYPMDWIDGSMASLSSFVKSQMSEGWLNDLITDALIQGIGGVIIFIPQIAILFFLLGILEHTGYLSRISFISDRFLRRFGLSGKSIIPLMSSWACAIPAIMSTRMIDNPRERMAIIMASPLMTCSARLPVYTILIAVLLPNSDGGFFGTQGLALLGLYLIGVVATLAVAYYYSRASKIENVPFWSLELPVYRMPNWRNILYNVYIKTKSFVVEAGKVILTISILLWFLSTNSPKSPEFIENQFKKEQATNAQMDLSLDSYELEYSYLGYIGKVIEPVIKPLGYDWKIGIALVSSFAAREVFVGTLSTIYSIGSEEESTIVERLRNEKIYPSGAMRFNWATSISLLLFYVFALQCMSTVAIVKKETGSWEFAILQFVLMAVLAYVFAFIGFKAFS